MDFWPRRIRHVNARNLSTLYHASWAKLSGSLGDLGTLLLLMIALAAQGSIDLASTLVVSGLFNIVTGIMFGIPLPVQPMNVPFMGVLKSSHCLPWVQVWSPRFVWPRWTGARDSSALWMSIGQLPLTTLNSALAVNALAADLLPEAHIPSVTAIGMSVAVMNLSGTWSGAMPLCHGAGGLASSCSVLFRGAKRSGASVIVWDW
ncbi:hypothetical protein E4U45_005535 [Claviceps purpurea]|nr:hypothetical protein E4U45_005535 [Claviceps purpurea]